METHANTTCPVIVVVSVLHTPDHGDDDDDVNFCFSPNVEIIYVTLNLNTVYPKITTNIFSRCFVPIVNKTSTFYNC